MHLDSDADIQLCRDDIIRVWCAMMWLGSGLLLNMLSDHETC